MKVYARILILVMVMALLVPLVPASAQEGEEEALSSFDAVLVLNASSGTMTDNGDGTYALVLEGVPENYTLVFSGPMLVYSISVEELSTAWAAAEGLTAEAVVKVEGLNMQMTLSAPQYDMGTLTFTAVVNALVSEDPTANVKDPVEAFESAVLSIGWSTELSAVLGAGAGGIRYTQEDCDMWMASYNDLASKRQTGKTSNQLWNMAYLLNTFCPAEYAVPYTVS
jgi:hypothetical protein